MARPDDTEVTTIKRNDSFLAEAFGHSNHRGVNETQRKTCILPAKLATAFIVDRQ